MEFSSYLYENQASFQDAVTSALTRLQEFLKKTKYTVSQINGSRILEVPKFSDLQEPEKGSEIFISKIPQLIFEDELMPLFSSVGIVYRMRLMLCFSGANKGFCYVQYINPQVASSAVEKLNGYEIREKRYLSVKKSIDNRRLFFGNIPKEIAREAIEDKLNSVLKDVNKYFVYSDEKDTNKNRGFVFVEFKTHRSAALTRRLYSKGFVLWGNNINVDWATPEEEIDDTQLLDVTDLFLRCITPGISDREIKAKIKHSLPQRTRFKVTKIRDFAFIHFEDHESAELGLKYLKDAEIKDYKFNIVWAHPSKLKKKNSNAETHHSSNICSLTSPNQLMKRDRSNAFSNTHSLIYSDINGNSSSSNGYLPGCLDCTTFPQDSRSYIGSEINTNSLLDRNFFSERNHLTTLQGLTHPVASELTGRPLWPIYFQSQVPENNPHNLAKQLLQICSFRLYEAFALFARQMGWGEIACEITPQTQNGNTVYISKIHVKEAPTDVQSALMSLVKPFCAATEDAAREASAYKIWKLILPHLQIPLFSQYIY